LSEAKVQTALVIFPVTWPTNSGMKRLSATPAATTTPAAAASISMYSTVFWPLSPTREYLTALSVPPKRRGVKAVD
jgi:hypothetical protein